MKSTSQRVGEAGQRSSFPREMDLSNLFNEKTLKKRCENRGKNMKNFDKGIEMSNFKAIFVFCVLIFGSSFLFASDYETQDLNARAIRNIIAQYEGTDKDTAHSYVEPYTQLLEPFRDRNINLLEIGVFLGGSAIVWHDYLPHSKLFLVDIQNRMLPHILSAMDPNRYHFYLYDAYCHETVMKLRQECPEGFDIIIDDGSHHFHHQSFIIEEYVNLLKNGGVLIIEDVQHFSFIETLNQKVTDDSQFQIEIIDLRRLKKRRDDLIFVVRKTRK